MQKKTWSTLFLALSLHFATAIPSKATTFMPVPFSSAVQDAPIIVRGKVGMSYTDLAQDPDGAKRIFTLTEIQPNEVLKGDPQAGAKAIMVRELGGEKDGIGYNVPGTAQFQRGEDTVIFLNPANQDGAYDVHGMMMGKYNVITDSEGQEALDGPGLMSSSPDPGAPPEKWTLDRLRKLIEKQSGSGAPPHSAPSVSPAHQMQSLNTQSAPSSTGSSALIEPQEDDREGWKQWGLWGIILASGAVIGILRSRSRRR